MFDVSIILNLHQESIYLNPTLKSLKRAINNAQKLNISVEVVVVFDNTDVATQINFEKFKKQNENLEFKTLFVENFSLAKSRNSGLDVASGKYIFTADADDLISQNSIVELFKLAETDANKRSAYFPHYLVAFGDKYYVAEFVGSASLGPGDFIANNTFTSRIFINRELLNEFRFIDSPFQSGFGHEDWDLVNRLFVSNIELKVCQNTILFYRVRLDGLLHSTLQFTENLVNRISLHSVEYALNTDNQSQELENKFKNEGELESRLGYLVCSNPILLDFIGDAIRDEPTILFDLIKGSIDYSPYPIDKFHWANCYLRLLRVLRESDFTDIVLLESLNPGGAEKYILQILDSLENFKPDSKVLIFTFQEVKEHLWRDLVSDKFSFFDVRNSFPYLSNLEIEKLLVNSIFSLGKVGGRIHLKTFQFGQDFITKYQNVIANNFDIIYYRFSDSFYELNGERFRDGHIISFLRGTNKKISKIFTDNNLIIESDKEFLGDFHSDKYFKIPIAIEKPNDMWQVHQPNFKLFWASRFTSEKRPELIPEILFELQKHFPNLEIDVYGADFDENSSKILQHNSYINQRGSFKSFYEIPISNYDMLIYTTAFDGMPNILLEAMSTGIPIVAPNIGGISEIDPNKYYLIETAEDERMLVFNYSKKIMENYENWDLTIKNATKVSETVLTNFSKEAQIAKVQEVFNGN